MGEALLALGSILLAVAFLLWRDGSSWGELIAWFLAMWGVMFVGWGLIAGWYRSATACILGAILAAASAVSAFLWIQGGWWQAGIGCAVGGSLGVVVGGLRARQLLRARRR